MTSRDTVGKPSGLQDSQLIEVAGSRELTVHCLLADAAVHTSSDKTSAGGVIWLDVLGLRQLTDEKATDPRLDRRRQGMIRSRSVEHLGHLWYYRSAVLEVGLEY